MSSDTKQILVTGASGFIGRQTVRELLDDGWNVTAIGRASTDWSSLPDSINKITDTGNIDDLMQAVAGADPQVVLHLATCFVGQHKPSDIDPLVDANIRFGMQLAEACSKLNNPLFINIGTIWQHADSAEYAPMSLYAATKEAFADILRYYSDYGLLRVLNLKLTDTYGPGDTRPKIWSLLVRTAKQNETLKMSPGEQLIDPLYIDDVVAALRIAIDLGLSSNEANVNYRVPGELVSIRELVKRFGEVIGEPLSVEWGATPYRAKERFEEWKFGDVLPGWTQKVSLEEGIAHMWAEAQAN